MKTGRNFWRFLAGSDPKALNTGPPVLGNLQCPSKMLLHPSLQPLIVGIGPDELDPGEQEVEIGKDKHAADLVMEIGWMNLDLQDCAFRIDKHLPLATGDLLAAIVAARSTGFSGLHGLTVGHSGGGLRFPARCRAVLFSQDLVYTLPFAVLAPFIKVIIYLLPGRKIVRHHPPGNATTEQIEASIDDATHVIVRLLPPFLAFREEPCDEGPFLIFEVRRISFAFHGSSLLSWQSPAPFQQPIKSDITPMVLFDFAMIFTRQPLSPICLGDGRGAVSYGYEHAAVAILTIQGSIPKFSGQFLNKIIIWCSIKY